MSHLDPDRPISPRRLPFFYGWVILAVGAIGVMFTTPGQTMGVSVFTEPLIQALRIDRTQLSLAYLAGTIVSGLILARGGRSFDRDGARLTAIRTIIPFGIVLIALGQIGHLVDGIARLIGRDIFLLRFALIALGFFAIRFLGQGMLTMCSRAMVGKWFHEYRGIAFSILGICTSIGFSLSPPFFHLLIENFGMSGAYAVLGSAVLLVMGLIAYVFFRDNPEECGLVMDGGPRARRRPNSNPDLVIRREFTRAEALATLTFWTFNLAFGLNGLLSTAYTFHILDLSRDTGIAAHTLLWLFVPVSVVSVTTNITLGLISNRIRLKYALAVMNVGMLVYSCSVLLLPSKAGLALLVIGMGVAGGCFGNLSGVVWPRFFGRLHLGAISGIYMSTAVIGSALGPYFFSLSKVFLDSYDAAFISCAAVAAGLALLSLFADNPQNR